MTPRSSVLTVLALAALALTTLAVAPAAAQSRDNPVCDSNASDLWKRDTRFLEVWWNQARPVDVAECLDAGADPDAVSILRHAAEWTRFPAVVQMLLEAGAYPNPIGSGVASPLYRAVQRTDNVTVVHGVVAALLFANADVGPDRFGYTPLYHVLGNQPNSVALVELLLQVGADPNGSWGPVTPLHHAAQQTANPQVLEALLAVGADPNAKTSLGTPLHIAIDRCRQMLVRTLLEHGAASQGSLDDNGPNPLHRALMNSEVTVAVVRALLEAGADPIARDQDGDTPLHIAAGWTDDVAIIDALLNAGADVRAQNEDGNRPVDLAWDIRRSEAYLRLVVPEGPPALGRTFNGSLRRSPRVLGTTAHITTSGARQREPGNSSGPCRERYPSSQFELNHPSQKE